VARYRKIDLRIWGDQKFRTLTPIPPCGQGLWIYLLTSPLTTNIAGVFRAGEAALAEDLRWPLKAFRRHYLEIAGRGMVKADWSGPLVWVPKAIYYSEPESPNVIRSWRPTWDEIPECPMKLEIHAYMKAFAEALGEGFAKAFGEGCSRPPIERSISDQKGPSFYQEQEQDQEQDQIPPTAPPGGHANGNGLAAAGEFREWYLAYPVHTAPRRAERAYRGARKRGATREELLEAVARQKAERVELQAAMEFVPRWPDPATWLNGDRWQDEPRRSPRTAGLGDRIRSDAWRPPEHRKLLEGHKP